MRGRGRIIRPRIATGRQLRASAVYAASLLAVSEGDLSGRFAMSYRPGQHVRRGRQRNAERQMAMHLAREAFGISKADLARAAGISRQAAYNAVTRVWIQRDVDEDLDGLLWAATARLQGDAA